jgi:phosphate acetyltransferase
MRVEEDVGMSSKVAPGPSFHGPESKYESLIARAQVFPPVPTVVVHPCDETSLRGATEAAAARIIVPMLVGPLRKISETAKQFGIDIGSFDVIDVAHSDAAAARAVELVQQAKGELLMKAACIPTN